MNQPTVIRQVPCDDDRWQPMLFAAIVDFGSMTLTLQLFHHCYEPEDLFYFGDYAIKAKLVTRELIVACYKMDADIKAGVSPDEVGSRQQSGRYG